MTTALQSLLKYPHAAVFDKAPGASLALRVRHPDGAVWSVADELLTVTAGDLVRTYDLSEFTVGGLAVALEGDGFEVLNVSAEWQSRSALVLVEGRGDQGESNGDHLVAFTSILWGLLTGYAAEIRGASYQVGQALRQMVITQAEGEWLDLWGTLYSVGRNADETDADYAPRIPEEAFRIRVNAHGIEKAIFDATGWDVRIEEPWKEIFHLDLSELSGTHRFYDGERTGHHLIQPVARQEVDWVVVLAIIERNRAAGVLVLSPLVRRISFVDATTNPIVIGGVHSEFYAFARYEDRPLLDYNLVLDDNSDVIVNHASRYQKEIMRSSFLKVPVQSWGSTSWLQQPWKSEYFVQSGHIRDYRVYFLNLAYSSQYWTDRFSWTSAESAWTGLNPIIDSGHARSES